MCGSHEGRLLLCCTVQQSCSCIMAISLRQVMVSPARQSLGRYTAIQESGEKNCLAACGCKARVSCHKHAGLMIPGRAASFWRCWMLLCRTGRCIGAECCVSSHGVWDHCAGVDQAEAGSDVGPQRHLHGRNRLPVPGPPGHCRALRGWAACRVNSKRQSICSSTTFLLA